MTLNRKRLIAARVLVVVLAALAALPLLAQTESKTPTSAQEQVNAALKTAKAENKTVMVDFSASW
jgi:thiol:disulfide interchange protein